MNKKEIKAKFKNLLPRGFVKQIQDRIAAEGGTIPDASWVSKVCNAKTTNWDDQIISHALTIAAEQKAKVDALNTKAAAL